jgi:hypothetical protein
MTRTNVSTAVDKVKMVTPLIERHLKLPIHEAEADYVGPFSSLVELSDGV